MATSKETSRGAGWYAMPDYASTATASPRPEAGVLVVDDETPVRDALRQWFEKDGVHVDTASDAAEALRKLHEWEWGVILLDIRMPSIDGLELQRRIMEADPDAVVVMMTAYASVETAVQAMKQGAFDYVTKPIDPDDLSRLVDRAIAHRRLKLENVRLRRYIERLTDASTFLGESPEIRDVMKQIETAASSDVPVLIRGERGSGKELVARRIHSLSNRRHMPMIPVHCGAFSESECENELYGHEAGAVAGANYRHKGVLEAANGGTLFLDEVGAIATKNQVNLLQVLESKQITRRGGRQPVPVDFRVISATDQDLENLLEKGAFREDLYYRLNVFEIYIPPLRERRADIPLLARHFVEQYARALKRPVSSISNEAIEALTQSNWDGNMRELANAIERAVVVTKKSVIQLEDLPFQLVNERRRPRGKSLAAMERAHILDVLEQAKWNITRSAKTLGIDRVTLYNKIKKYGLRK